MESETMHSYQQSECYSGKEIHEIKNTLLEYLYVSVCMLAVLFSTVVPGI